MIVKEPNSIWIAWSNLSTVMENISCGILFAECWDGRVSPKLINSINKILVYARSALVTFKDVFKSVAT